MLRLKLIISFWLCVSTALFAENETRRPNILWMVVEDANPLASCYGTQSLVKTPNVDSLAAQGIAFNRAYATSGVCSTSRSALITGVMQTTFGGHHHQSSIRYSPHPEHAELGMIYLPEGMKTIPELMQKAGYLTFWNDKDDWNFEFSESEMFNSSKQTALSQKEKPWFGAIKINGGKLSSKLNNNEVYRKIVGKPTDGASIDIPPYYPDIKEVREVYAKHYDTWKVTDAQVGDIIKNLEANDQLANTVIFFFSDHGMPHGLRHKQTLYQGGTNVPLIVKLPESIKTEKRGRIDSDLVSLIDVSATTLKLAGLDLPKYLEGRDFLDTEYARDYVVSALDMQGRCVDHIRAVTTQRFAYHRNYLPGRPYLHHHYRENLPIHKAWKALEQAGKLDRAQARHICSDDKPKEELYDLKNDPHQIHNLAGDPAYKEALQTHRDLLDEWQKATDDKGQYPIAEGQLLQML